ncbi:hypothetical protein LTR74_017427 [Friedmanniomyces endolithicus]|nr:hypothetical protein LTR74_017427 [Friedmanniomyces endolithicus]
MDSYGNARRQTAENAALMWALTETPSLPSETLAKPKAGSWEVDLEREKQLADDLAFLVCVWDDPTEVRAVCIEEDQNGSGITIRIATNTGDPSHTVLELQVITDVMVQATRRPMIDRKTSVRDSASITSTHNKDASRSDPVPTSIPAYLEHVETKGRCGFGPLLIQTVSQCQKVIKGGKAKNSTASVRAQAERLNEAFEALERCQNREETVHPLEALIVMAYTFDTQGLTATLKQDVKLNQSLVAYLPEVIGKLGRYVRISFDLTNAARMKHVALFHRIKVAKVTFQQVSPRTFDGTSEAFRKTWSRVVSGSPDLQTSLSRLHIQDRKWKGHAEIQLLLFYELNSLAMPPRMIRASNSACYLCNLFIITHCKFAVPRTYGRIYEKWYLPDWSSISGDRGGAVQTLMERFNAVLAQEIKAVLQLVTLPKTHPAESVLFAYKAWPSESTIPPISDGQLGSLYQAGLNDSVELEERRQGSLRGGETCSLFHDISRDAAEEFLSPVHDEPSQVLVPARNRAKVMIPGQKIHGIFQEGRSLDILAGDVDFYLSMPSGGHTLSATDSPVWHKYKFAVEYEEQSLRIIECDLNCQMVDLKSLEPGRDMVFGLEDDTRPLRILCFYKRQKTLLAFRTLQSERTDAVLHPAGALSAVPLRSTVEKHSTA